MRRKQTTNLEFICVVRMICARSINNVHVYVCAITYIHIHARTHTYICATLHIYMPVYI